MHPSGRTYLLDGHTHTFACGHAYSTIIENARAAKARGMALICWTEHGPALKGSVTDVFFRNLRTIPPVIEGVRVLKGMEANIMDKDGTLDAGASLLSRLEIVSASLHEFCIKPGSVADNTDAVLGALCNPQVDFLCHLGNPAYPIDYETVVKSAAKNGKLIEINNGSFYIRKGSKDNCERIAALCAKHSVPVLLGTDTHFTSGIGRFPFADRALLNAGVPDELIINLDPKRLTNYLESRGRTLGSWRETDGNDLYPDYFIEDPMTFFEE